MDRGPYMILEGERSSSVACRNSQGTEVNATLLRLSRLAAVFEVYNPHSLLQLSEVLSEFKIILNDRLLYSGRAVVHRLVNAGFKLVCEASLEDSWRDVETLTPGIENDKLRDGFQDFIQQWQRVYKVGADFKVVVADIQTFMADLRRWLEQVELGIRASPSDDRIKMEHDIAHELGKATTPAIGCLFERFEALCDKVEPELQPAHRTFARRQLHPLLLCSPFVYRTFQKPLGFAGDYEVVNMISRDPLEGSSLFAKAVNLWFLKQAPAEAHRNRLRHLHAKMALETSRLAARGRAARVFNLGCGPAIEVQDFLAATNLSERASFTLADFDQETLVYARSALDQARATHHRNTSIQFLKRSVTQLLKEAGKTIERPPDQQYDFVYCAGLFDYLSDDVCRRLMNLLYGWVAPGGLLLATNVDRSNPSRQTMDYMLEWHLIYRSSSEFAQLIPDQAPPDSCAVTSDPTGVNLYLEIRKPPAK